MIASGVGARSDVELRLPADGAYAAVLRTLTAGLAARLDFTMDDIEDLRIAVSEATAMVLDQADAGADLVCKFRLEPGELRLEVAAAAESPAAPDYDSFGWQVLTTLTSAASVEATRGQYAVLISVHSSLDPSAVDGAGL
ncbi:ATP-binding protein [Nocardioides bizhenqiangii]|uniref:Anti-sigma factor n=1 Tax=Nocardioides bizhenqiangii TaxID=3095076 RepID=A0ABZ0ZLU5_9ACTN|nr:anti-sigma factor [Nocardioides sp. HM61]WQQ25222.1 anti-sigma factor [Nocardioides sp. HM61]